MVFGVAENDYLGNNSVLVLIQLDFHTARYLFYTENKDFQKIF
jgi:hypothetical protein